MAGPEALLGTFLLWLVSSGSVTSSRYVYTEIIVPKQLKSKEHFQTETDVSYILRVEGSYKIVHLKHITFIVPNMPVYSYNMKGDRIADYPYIQDDCYYNGYVEDVADSQVVLSICNGLWGYVRIETLNYEIEPIESSFTFQHIIYRRAQEEREPCRGVLQDGANLTSDPARIPTVFDDSSDSSDTEGDRFESHTTDRYLEFYCVVDKSKLFIRRQNETQLVRNILIIMADVHSIYLEIGLHVYLVGLELWTEKDYIRIGKTLPETLREFQTYASDRLLPRVNFDHSTLITTRGDHLGVTSAEHYCQYNFASVSVIRSVGSLKSDADQIAHVLGHSLGFFHDDLSQYCDCDCFQKPGSCIMRSDYSTGACRRLSNCSRRVYYDLIRKPGKECLLNKPRKVFKHKVCGNGIRDHDEDCDCGHDEECRRSGCCQPNCKFRPGADCLDGLCCEQCKYLPEGAMCRKTASKCDLAEYCNGAEADCPPDVYKQDGIPCDTGAGCYAGQCLGLQRQCVALFGKDANVAPWRCFEEVNMRGDRSGNCGEEGMKFKKCKIQDVFCGRLQCTNVDTIPRLPTRQAVLQTPVENVMCWGAEFHLGLAYDLGAVRDGTPCGAGKICLNGSCVTLEVLRQDCDLNRCNLRGVCNNRRNCHCAYGWAPPFCEGKGYGGSVDSGPPPVYRRNLAVIFAVVTLVGGILSAFLVISILKREQLKGWLAKSYEEREPSESESEPEDTTEATSEPQPPPEPRNPLPIKRTQSRLLPAKQTSQPEPRQQSQHTLQPEPRPQPLYTPQPEPRPQPQHVVQPAPRPKPPRTLEPEPRPQPQRTLQPEPRPQPQHTIKPELRPQPQRTLQPEPRPQPQRTLQPEPRPQPQRSLQPESRPQSQRTLLPESRPQSQRTPQPEARPQPQRTPQPEARPQREPTPQPQHTLQPEPRTQPPRILQPEPKPQLEHRPQSQYLLQPKHRPQPQHTPKPEPRPLVPELPLQPELRLQPEKKKIIKPAQKPARSSS